MPEIRLDGYRSLECCAECQQPKSRTNKPGEEVVKGWPVCINPDCPLFGHGVASARYRLFPDAGEDE